MAHLLLSIASSLNDAQTIRDQIKDLQHVIEDSPDKSYQQAVLDLKARLDRLWRAADRSSIPKGNEVRCFISGLSSVMAAIVKKHSATLDTSCSSDCSTSSRTVNIPKLPLPTFHVDPMRWTIFWERFQVAVHSNDKMDVSHKLTYLRKP